MPTNEDVVDDKIFHKVLRDICDMKKPDLDLIQTLSDERKMQLFVQYSKVVESLIDLL